MSSTFYDHSVGSYLQILGGVAGVLEKGRAAAAEQGFDLDELAKYRLRDDMAPFSFQIISVWHHSMGALKGMQAGLFEPPPTMSGMSFDKCEALVREARAFLEALNRESVNALSGNDMLFRIGSREVPFTTDSFLLSFSLPNFYFHATTTYSVLRIHGVPLGKMDFLGPLRTDLGT